MFRIGLTLTVTGAVLGLLGYFFTYVDQSGEGADIGAAGALTLAPLLVVCGAFACTFAALRDRKSSHR